MTGLGPQARHCAQRTITPVRLTKPHKRMRKDSSRKAGHQFEWITIVSRPHSEHMLKLRRNDEKSARALVTR